MTYGHPVPVLGLIIMMMTTNDNIQMIYGTIHCLKLSPNLRRSLEEETNLEEKDEKLDVSNEENHFSKLFQISRNQKWKNYFLPKFLTNQRIANLLINRLRKFSSKKLKMTTLFKKTINNVSKSNNCISP